MPVSVNPRRSIVRALRWGMLFTVGSLLVVKERTEDFVNEAFEKGQKAQQEGKTLVQAMRAEKPRQQKVETDPLQSRVNVTLERLNVPTETEIHELNQQIDLLSARIEALQATDHPE
jgi:polyhydroxyalkanoate synthesis regulator phasin